MEASDEHAVTSLWLSDSLCAGPAEAPVPVCACGVCVQVHTSSEFSLHQAVWGVVEEPFKLKQTLLKMCLCQHRPVAILVLD